MIKQAFPTFGSVRVTVSEHAVRLRPIFPDKPSTKRRRRRTIGKFGNTWFAAPTAVMLSGTHMLIHPKLYAEIKVLDIQREAQ